MSLTFAEAEFEAQHLHLELGGVRILHEVTVKASARRIAIIGANGSGKTSFARLLTGLVAPSGGSLRVLGYDAQLQARELRQATSLLFSNPDAQIIMPTVAEDIAFTLRGRKVPRAEHEERIDRVLARVGLSGFRDARAHELSGGQKQLLAIASVLVAEPQLVIADEPTAYLDAVNARRVARLLLDELDAGLVLVTHDLRLAARCDLALYFRAGTLAGLGEPAAMLARYEGDLDALEARP